LLVLAELNNRIVNSLEQLGEYRKPMWYSSMVASAAPIMYEHDLVFKREELLDRCVTKPSGPKYLPTRD
jgi:hypothetical protein